MECGRPRPHPRHVLVPRWFRVGTPAHYENPGEGHGCAAYALTLKFVGPYGCSTDSGSRANSTVSAMSDTTSVELKMISFSVWWNSSAPVANMVE